MSAMLRILRALSRTCAMFLGVACSTPPPPPAAMPPTPPAPSSSATPPTDERPQPPKAKREAHETTIHDRKLVDEYFWLRKKGTPDVVSYLEAENSYTASMTKSLEPFSQKLYDEMLARIKHDDDTRP